MSEPSVTWLTVVQYYKLLRDVPAVFQFHSLKLPYFRIFLGFKEKNYKIEYEQWVDGLIRWWSYLEINKTQKLQTHARMNNYQSLCHKNQTNQIQCGTVKQYILVKYINIVLT